MSNYISPYDLWEEVHNPPKLFFEDEVRDGFLVSTMMKRYWAAQMKVLAEIDKVCKRHNIRWFADYGTLLGAVRHGGYIPWDDDMDICMLRDDYVGFIEFAAEELPKGYEVMTLQRNEEFEFAIGRINNTHFINYNDDHLESHFGCPYLVGIDVFPLDGLFADKNQEEERVRKLKDVGTALIYISENLCDCAEYRNLINKIERENGVSIKNKDHPKRELMLLADELYVLVSPKDAEYLAMMTHWASKGNHRYKKEWFDRTLYLPYEYIHLPVPACYDKVLKAEYGNYMKVVKGGGAHEYPLYSEQEKILKEEIGENPYRYTMPDFARDKREIASISERCSDILSMLDQVYVKIRQLFDAGESNAAEQLLIGSKTLIDSLELIVKEKQRYYDASISAFNEYGELINCIDSHSISEEIIDKIEMLFTELKENIEINSERKEVLFLPVKVDWWQTMEPEWRIAVSDERNDVYVMPLLYLEKDFVRDNGEEKNDGNLLPEYVKCTSIEEYDIAKRHPDTVYIQDPYDGYNTMLAVPDYFYSNNLLSFTDELIYVPCYAVDNPESEDDKITSVLRIIVEQPAVYFADRIIVRDEKIKQVYIDILLSITGSDSMDYWNEKIIVSNSDYSDGMCEYDKGVSERRSQLFKKYNKEYDPGKSILLTQINAAFILQCREKAVDKIESSLSLIKQYNESVLYIISFHESMDQLPQLVDDSKLIRRLDILKKSLENDDVIVFDQNRMVEEYLDVIDAYYGNEGECAHRIRMNSKPVMIMTINEE